MNRYIIATIKPWNIAAYERHVGNLPGDWTLLTDPGDLTLDKLEKINPRYIFFPHWSWIVPKEILERFECVCFHMTDVPFGRGGSPLQNLISRHIETTKLTALRMSEELDAGPVYGKLDLSLDGPAHEIFERVAELCYEHVIRIVAEEPAPLAQEGDGTYFPRRTPDQSVLPETGQLTDIYDHIRMLDAESYPYAFLDHGAFKLTFRNARLVDGSLEATVRITVAEGEDNE